MVWTLISVQKIHTTSLRTHTKARQQRMVADRLLGIAGWNNNRTRHACISNDDPLSGRTFQYSPSEAPDVDARLADSSESEGGIDPIRILGTFN